VRLVFATSGDGAPAGKSGDRAADRGGRVDSNPQFGSCREGCGGGVDTHWLATAHSDTAVSKGVGLRPGGLASEDGGKGRGTVDVIAMPPEQAAQCVDGAVDRPVSGPHIAKAGHAGDFSEDGSGKKTQGARLEIRLSSSPSRRQRDRC